MERPTRLSSIYEIPVFILRKYEANKYVVQMLYGACKTAVAATDHDSGMVRMGSYTDETTSPSLPSTIHEHGHTHNDTNPDLLSRFLHSGTRAGRRSLLPTLHSSTNSAGSSQV
jgi:hypothetical protein